MYCQECGAQIRQTARFCNKCGTTVKQRFGKPEPPPAPPAKRSGPAPQSGHHPPPSNNPWPRVDETLLMPAVGKPAAEPRVARRPEEEAASSGPRVERPTIFEPPAPKPAVPPHESQTQSPRTAPPRAAASHPSTETMRRESANKPFFTQFIPAVSNRQHSRLVVTIPILLIVVILVFVLAYIAAK